MRAAYLDRCWKLKKSHFEIVSCLLAFLMGFLLHFSMHKQVKRGSEDRIIVMPLFGGG